MTLFWIKASSSALLGTVFHLGRAEQLHFYHNLGFSTTQLYALTLVLDLLLWVVMIIVTAQFL
ncbi:MAG TPA: hypothetical protein VK589_22260 [Chryseolinea sp.]|nr:hypothetical protein [Chryseolinea sp.]